MGEIRDSPQAPGCSNCVVSGATEPARAMERYQISEGNRGICFWCVKLRLPV